MTPEMTAIRTLNKMYEEGNTEDADNVVTLATNIAERTGIDKGNALVVVMNLGQYLATNAGVKDA